MNKRKRGQLHILAVLVLGLSVATVVLFTLLFAPEGQKRILSGKLTPYNDLWVLKNYNGNEDEIITLPCKKRVNAGDTITIMGKVPPDVVKDTVLVFDTQFQNVKVMQNDQTIYSYGVMNNQGRMKSAVPNTNVVKLVDAEPTDIITIYLTSAYKKYSGRLPEIYYGTEGAVASDLFVKHGISLVIAVTLLLLTLIFIIAVVCMKQTDFDKEKAVYAFLFSFCAALWSVVKNPILQLVLSNRYGLYLLEMILLMLMPILFMLYQSCFSMRRRFVKIFEMSVYVYSVNLLVGVVFQAMSICDFVSYMTFTKGLIFAGLLGLIAVLSMAKDNFDDPTLNTNLLAGVILLGAWIVEGFLSVFRIYAAYDGLVFMAGLYIYVILITISMLRHIVREVNREKNTVLSNVNLEKKHMLAGVNMNLVYGALNDVIHNLKEKDYDDSRLVYDASIYMQNSLKAVTDTELVPFAKELEYIRAYAGIATEKYPGLSFVIEDKVVNFMVPFHTIEALVENAVLNGALKSETEGRIVLRSYERLDCFAIQIVDNGTGIGPDKRFSGKPSYKEIKHRLKAVCKAGIEIKTKPDKGTIVTVKIPKEGYIIKE